MFAANYIRRVTTNARCVYHEWCSTPRDRTIEVRRGDVTARVFVTASMSVGAEYCSTDTQAELELKREATSYGAEGLCGMISAGLAQEVDTVADTKTGSRRQEKNAAFAEAYGGARSRQRTLAR